VARALSLLLSLFIAVSVQAADLTVKRVVDGDTLLLSDGQRVRLIGVDTPEHHPSAKLKKDAGGSKRRAAVIRALGKRATGFVTQIVKGRAITMAYEKSNASRGHRDRYGRTLAYVHFKPAPCDELELWAADDACEAAAYEEGFLNALIIEAGYGSAYTKFPFRYLERFRRLEAEARRNNRGLWRPEPQAASATTQEPAVPQNVSWVVP